MRKPRNDAAELIDTDGDAGPERRCILSGERAPRAALVRLALGPDGTIAPDVRARAPGRGAWIAVDRATLEAASAKGRLRGALARAFKTGEFAIPDDLGARTAAALERNALDRLGLEARSGTLLTGSERIETAARSGALQALYHAADAGADGAGKLAQAWRVGSDAQGSGLAGVTLPVDRTILAGALGRENVVHIGLIDAGAAARVRDALDRWLHFIGHPSLSPPCASDAQGSSAAAAPLPHDDEQGTQTPV